MLLRSASTGGFEVYDIANNNNITNAAFLGTVGLDWQFAGIAAAHGPGTSDLVLRNKNTGAFEVYDIAGNTLVGAGSLGAVGLDWQLGGFAVDPPTESRRFCCKYRRSAAGRGNHGHPATNQIGSQCRQPIIVALSPNQLADRENRKNFNRREGLLH
jgi:hypothetical protein